MYVEESVVINQPVEKVFDYVSNPVNYPEWAGPVVEVRGLQQTAPGEERIAHEERIADDVDREQYESVEAALLGLFEEAHRLHRILETDFWR
jgi:uncharacterized protein YndB with AHSA1/START domain